MLHFELLDLIVSKIKTQKCKLIITNSIFKNVNYNKNYWKDIYKISRYYQIYCTDLRHKKLLEDIIILNCKKGYPLYKYKLFTDISIIACHYSHIKIIKKLLKIYNDNSRSTMFLYLYNNNNYKILKYLLTRYTINLKHHNHKYPIIISLIKDDKYRHLKILIRYTNINLVYNNNELLKIAFYYGSVKIVKFLLQIIKKPLSDNNYGITRSCRYNNINIVIVLLNYFEKNYTKSNYLNTINTFIRYSKKYNKNKLITDLLSNYNRKINLEYFLENIDIKNKLYIRNNTPSKNLNKC